MSHLSELSFVHPSATSPWGTYLSQVDQFMGKTDSGASVASALGVIVLGETLHPDGLGWFGLAVAVVAMVVATAALARGAAITTTPATSTSPAGHPC